MDTRAALLAAAAQEFARLGLKGARIREIVARSGVNERMIYHHFGSKEGLYQAVFKHEAAGVKEVWREALEQAAGMEPYDGVRHVYRTYFDMMHARPLLLALVTQEAVGGWGARPQMSDDAVPEELRALYDQGVAEGIFSADLDLDVVYVTAVSALVSVPGMAGHFPDLIARRGMAALRDQVVALLMDGMTGERK
ncbi:TetR/AcrR family transcriptional regulator [Actinocrispum wychmicini]|uniref:TetR family transcriptional regulator n=1 Tax=Actinocrispum wychmicini TaxID=1213861 RepID=A0A4R2K782_9PSEU|nr:TetR/AcrR family transcriptional regulator [Actinocrispum wychmicini]TCO65826.1 TetR family transcriptional regulator [Actinocrispum wychmicini]